MNKMHFLVDPRGGVICGPFNTMANAERGQLIHPDGDIVTVDPQEGIYCLGNPLLAMLFTARQRAESLAQTGLSQGEKPTRET